MDFRWNGWNIEHLARHGVTPQEAEWVVRQASKPFPRMAGGGKFFVWGRGMGGRLLQVIYIVDPDGTQFVLHGRLLSNAEKRRFHRIERA